MLSKPIKKKKRRRWFCYLGVAEVEGVEEVEVGIGKAGTLCVTLQIYIVISAQLFVLSKYFSKNISMWFQSFHRLL